MQSRPNQIQLENEVPSLVRGGSAWRLQQRLGLLGADGLPTVGGAVKVALFCWLPMAALAGFDPRNWNLQYEHSFFADLGVYSRYLIAVFVLLITDRATDHRLHKLLVTFEKTGIVNREMHAEFGKRIVVGDRRTSSGLAETIMLALSVVSVLASVVYLSQNNLESWMSPMPGFPGPLSLAGWWNLLVSAPLYFFLTFRWLWRLTVWTLLMRDLANLPLQLVATHPDKAGGLGFLTIFPAMFLPLIFSLSMVFATGVLQTLMIEGGQVTELEYTVVAWLTLVLIVFVGPLGLFTPKLLALKEQSIVDYGTMVSHYNRVAESHMLEDFAQDRPLDKETVAMLSDISAGLETIKSMKPMPVEFFALIPLIISALLPLIAVAAIKFPMVGSLLWSLFSSLI